MVKSRVGVWASIINLIIAGSVLFYTQYYLWHIPQARVIAAIAALSIIVQLVYIFIGTRFLHRTYMYITMIHVMYLVLEVIVYGLFCFNIVRGDTQFISGSLEATSAKWAVYDPLIGYKGIPGSFRNAKYVDGKKVYDHTVKINKQGWFSKLDYSQPKSNKKRYMVLGDSYSAGYNVPMAWPDQVNDKLQDIELYNFSMEGIGITNWLPIFQHEVSSYDYDGVIIAVSNENNGIPDMDRPLMVMHSLDDGTYIGTFDSLVTTAYFEDTYLPEMLKGYAIYSRQQMDEILQKMQKNPWQFQLKEPGFYFLRTTLSITHQVLEMFELMDQLEAYHAELQARMPCNEPILSFDQYTNKFPKAKWLKQIVDSCKINNKEVVLVAIPDKDNSINHWANLDLERELESVANDLNIKYFSGFSVMRSLPVETIESSYYKGDLHWNTQGTAYFSYRFTRWLKNEQTKR